MKKVIYGLSFLLVGITASAQSLVIGVQDQGSLHYYNPQNRAVGLVNTSARYDGGQKIISSFSDGDIYYVLSKKPKDGVYDVSATDFSSIDDSVDAESLTLSFTQGVVANATKDELVDFSRVGADFYFLGRTGKVYRNRSAVALYNLETTQPGIYTALGVVDGQLIAGLYASENNHPDYLVTHFDSPVSRMVSSVGGIGGELRLAAEGSELYFIRQDGLCYKTAAPENNFIGSFGVAGWVDVVIGADALRGVEMIYALKPTGELNYTMTATFLKMPLKTFTFPSGTYGAMDTIGVKNQEDPSVRRFEVFRELPVGEIVPEGWMGELMEHYRSGLGGHYEESGAPFNTDMWLGKTIRNEWYDYEQAAYFVDGIYRGGVILKDDAFMDVGLTNILHVLEHQRPDGGLGPVGIGTLTADLIGLSKIEGRQFDSQWPMAVLTRAIMAYYDHTEDPRVLDVLTRYYHSFSDDFGFAARDANNIEGMCWLYEKTGDAYLMQLAKRAWTYSANGPNVEGNWTFENLWDAGPQWGHGVSVCEQVKLPALMYRVTGREEYLKASQGGFRSIERDHELVDGVISSDEKLHGKEAAGLHETCDIVDYTWGMGYMLQIDGQAKWGDKIERAVLNAGLGAIGKDFKTHVYFSSPNQVLITDTNCAGFGYPHRQTFRPGFLPPCCSGNIHRLFPNYISRMWMSRENGGLAATLYGPSVLRTTVGKDRQPIVIRQETDYPFDGKIRLEVELSESVEFPLYLRIPAWAEGATVSLNGKTLTEEPKPGTFFKLERSFASGDNITLNFPMTVRTENPIPHGISLLRGPLVFSLKIEEEAISSPNSLGSNPDFMNWQFKAISPWNYALQLEDTNDLRAVKVNARAINGFPWTADSSPVVLRVPARRVPSWKLTPEGQNPGLPTPPLEIEEETEWINMIPLGATHLRQTVFPNIGEVE